MLCLWKAISSHLVIFWMLVSPILGVWRGGSLLASSPEFESMCVTKAEYEELGSARCRKRFFHWVLKILKVCYLYWISVHLYLAFRFVIFGEILKAFKFWILVKSCQFHCSRVFSFMLLYLREDVTGFQLLLWGMSFSSMVNSILLTKKVWRLTHILRNLSKFLMLTSTWLDKLLQYGLLNVFSCGRSILEMNLASFTLIQKLVDKFVLHWGT